MKIDINKKYRYRMGDPVRILCVDAIGPKCGGMPQPVVALDSKAGEVTCHFEDGRFDTVEQNNALDLIEVRESREWTLSVKPGTLKVSEIYEDEGPLDLHGWERVRVREIID